jgi:hypothetical protein
MVRLNLLQFFGEEQNAPGKQVLFVDDGKITSKHLR